MVHGWLMVEIYRLLHIDSDLCHPEQSGCVKGYYTNSNFSYHQKQKQKLTNSKSRACIYFDYYWPAYAAIFVFIIQYLIEKGYAKTLYISTMYCTQYNSS